MAQGFVFLIKLNSVFFVSVSIERVITVVCAQLGGDIGRIRMSIFLGSLVPLVMFLSWDAVALCITPLLGAKDPLDVFIRFVSCTSL